MELYNALAMRVVIDLRLQPMVFDLFELTVTRETGQALLDALAIVHNARCPVKRPPVDHG